MKEKNKVLQKRVMDRIDLPKFIFHSLYIWDMWLAGILSATAPTDITPGFLASSCVVCARQTPVLVEHNLSAYSEVIEYW